MMEGDVSNVSMEPRGFRVHIQKTLPFSARDGLAAWSPKLDLIAVVTENEHVLLYRMNGQRVWGFAHKAESDARVEKLNWRPDGGLSEVLVDTKNMKLIGCRKDAGAGVC
jgi:anaphase-promoting complex subunit 4